MSYRPRKTFVVVVVDGGGVVVVVIIVVYVHVAPSFFSIDRL